MRETTCMIQLHRLNKKAFFLNHRQIEIMEANPHTVITLANENKYIVEESISDIIALIRDYERQIVADPGSGIHSRTLSP
ncbi:MAG TPA: flagellar FlbD family protein [Leptospiraceae bacterium]|nr:flagellar FlbD family protein [Leptospiraceae bacterium]HNJ02981.1 flagellar FlbD family protein [Leptospiraceae bacterium]HQI19775.1 flagellar FlbD family protein [Leptospiraceae bacterium]